MMRIIYSRFAPRGVLCGISRGMFAFCITCGAVAFAQGNQTASPPVSQRASTVPPEYRIGAGDVLEVDVWKEPEASTPGVVVRADGKITVPLVKELEVTGLTTGELEKILQQKLAKFIPGAEVTVVVREVNSKKVYMIGAVKRAGPIKLDYPMTILQVLAEAGGITDFAKKSKIYVLRHEGDKDIRIPFNYSQVIKGEHIEQNIRVLPGDTIVVPQ